MRQLRKNIRCSPSVRSVLREVAGLSAQRCEPVYVVGGYVRDRLLGVESFDVDFAVEGDGVAFAHALARKVGGVCEGFTRFGTAIVSVPGFGKVDVASTRKESYPRPGALPVVVASDLASDLVRRDFTLNSIALRLAPPGRMEVVDPTGGLADLRRGLLRAHHDRTFEDDPTRVFRAVRFEQRFGFRIESRTLSWLKKAVKGRFLDRVSGERIRSELKLIFQEPRPERAVKRLAALGVWKALGATLRPVRDPAQAREAVEAYRRLGVALEEPWMVHLLLLADRLGEEPRKALADRLALSGVERKVLFQGGQTCRAAVKSLRSKTSTFGRLHGLLGTIRPEVRAALWAEGPGRVRTRLAAYEKALRATRAFLSGRDLIDLGKRPGPDFAALLDEAFRLQLDKVLRTRPQALQWLESKVLGVR